MILRLYSFSIAQLEIKLGICCLKDEQKKSKGLTWCNHSATSATALMLLK
jgi:hypothetical protein